jgi:hypothetical protein
VETNAMIAHSGKFVLIGSKLINKKNDHYRDRVKKDIKKKKWRQIQGEN